MFFINNTESWNLVGKHSHHRATQHSPLAVSFHSDKSVPKPFPFLLDSFYVSNWQNVQFLATHFQFSLHSWWCIIYVYMNGPALHETYQTAAVPWQLTWYDRSQKLATALSWLQHQYAVFSLGLCCNPNFTMTHFWTKQDVKSLWSLSACIHTNTQSVIFIYLFIEFFFILSSCCQSFDTFLCCSDKR